MKNDYKLLYESVTATVHTGDAVAPLPMKPLAPTLAGPEAVWWTPPSGWVRLRIGTAAARAAPVARGALCDPEAVLVPRGRVFHASLTNMTSKLTVGR